MTSENSRIGGIGPRRVFEHSRGAESTWMRGVLMPQRTCSVPDCEKPSRTRGWCPAHYSRWKKYGELGTAPIRSRVSTHPTRVCSVEGCERPHNCVGLCATHYQRWKTTKTVGPMRIRGYLAAEARDGEGRKQCRLCLQWLDVTHFIANSLTGDGLDGRCRRCRRDEKLTANFGISLADYESMLAAQGGACAICRTPPTEGEALSVDHDHGCCPQKGKSCGKCVRELLCSWCNRAIGMMKDDPDLLRTAAGYLERHRG